MISRHNGRSAAGLENRTSHNRRHKDNRATGEHPESEFLPDARGPANPMLHAMHASGAARREGSTAVHSRHYFFGKRALLFDHIVDAKQHRTS
jgi:hypothetical protein